MKPVESNGYPYDNYSLSLIAVIMNSDNTLSTVTTRWNSLDDDEESIGIGFLRGLLGRDVSLLLK